MSFREIRNFTECMRSLGYPRIVSVENFRNPNFELVTDCLMWLLERYDESSADAIDDDISTESDRVFFLKAVAQVFMTKARIKLNLKRLYAADGLAVKELLKIAQLLYQATAEADEDDDSATGAEFSLGAKAFDVKLTRQLASEITQKGAALYDALGEEEALREDRLRAISRNVDIEEIEAQVQEQIATVQENVENIERMLGNLEKDEKSLEGKIEKRRNELERSEKRLATLQSVRPAYMDEYERLQEGLQDLYVTYLERHRNLTYLESELESYNREEEEKAEEHEKMLKRMQQRLRAEEMKILRGEQQVDEHAGNFDDFEFNDQGGGGRGGGAATRVTVEGGGGRMGGMMARKFGGGMGGGKKDEAVMGDMMGGDDDDFSEDDGSSNSGDVSLGDDDDLIDDDDDDDMFDEDEGSSDNEF